MRLEDYCVIRLDASQHSRLDWKLDLARAEGCLEQGKPLLWYLDLGLFDRLNSDLSDQLQFRALGLAIEHFAGIISPELAQKSAGVAFFKGSFCDPGTEWQEALKQRDAWIDYLDLLLTHLPSEWRSFLIIEAPSQWKPLQREFFFSQESFSSWDLCFTDEPSGARDREAELAVIIPPQSCTDPSQWGELGQVLQELDDAQVPLRLIPAPLLTMEWFGLDYVVAAPEAQTSITFRQLQGFAAAGGTVISAGTPIDLPAALTWSEFSSRHLAFSVK